MRSARFFLSASPLAFAALFLAACAVGPDFTAPDAPAVSSYDSTPTPDTTADTAQTLQPGQDIPAEWWSLFHSDGLNALIIQALKDNPDLASADASLRVAQDNLSAADSELFPAVSGSFSSTRQKTSSAQNGGLFPGYIYTLHNASVSVSYGLDVFGGTRRAIEEQEAQTHQVGFEREAAYLTLTSNVVTSAIQEASLREQIDATRAIIGDQEHTLKILNARFDSGAVAKGAIAEQKAALANSVSTLPPLEQQLAVTRHELSILVGQMPSVEPGQTFTIAGLTLPANVPLSVPSKLVEQRPDVREAEENLHAASAAIGIAVAARLPEITLSADIGSTATKISNLFKPGGGVWSIGGSAAETLFDAGALADQEQAARDSYDVAAAQYRKTVLAAFQNVADTLHALQSDAQGLNAKSDAEKAAAESLALAHDQLDAGAISISDLLIVEQTEQQAKIALVQAQAQRYADTAALLAALGGGWWNRDKTNLVMGSDVVVAPESLKGAP